LRAKIKNEVVRVGTRRLWEGFDSPPDDLEVDLGQASDRLDPDAVDALFSGELRTARAGS
jgi:hypothetical protein